MRYVCSTCGKPLTSSRATLSREQVKLDSQGQPVLDTLGKEELLTITGRGLGTWRCSTPSHNVRFVTVIRDLSGGTERAKDMRAVPVTVKRHVNVRGLHG
jgi:hypothetical protein